MIISNEASIYLSIYLILIISVYLSIKMPPVLNENTDKQIHIHNVAHKWKIE